MKTLTILGSFVPMLLATACAQQASEGDGPDDQLSTGKGDGGFSQCELDAVVTLLNTSVTAEHLVNGGVNRTAAYNLIAHRNGPDGIFETADDDLFDHIAEVDAVDRVGPVTIGQLVEAYGQCDPRAPESSVTLFRPGHDATNRNIELAYSEAFLRVQPEVQGFVIQASTLEDLTCFEQDPLDPACVTLRIHLPRDARAGEYNCSTDGVLVSAQANNAVFDSNDTRAHCSIHVNELGPQTTGYVEIFFGGELWASDGSSLRIGDGVIFTIRGEDVAGD